MWWSARSAPAASRRSSTRSSSLWSRERKPSSYGSPTPIASSTVVMPADAISPSCACTAACIGNVTLGRGITWRSRLSVCISTRPGSR
jgi:hypothetical protein